MKLDESNFDNTGFEDCSTLNDFVRKIARNSLRVWGDLIEMVHDIMGHISTFESNWDLRDHDDFSPYVYSDLDVMVDSIRLVPDAISFKVFKCGIVPYPSIDIEVHLKVSLSRHTPVTIDISIGGISTNNKRGLNLHYDVIDFCDNLDMYSMGDHQDIHKLGSHNIGKALANMRNEDLSSIFGEMECEGGCLRKFVRFHLIETSEDHPRLLCSGCHTNYFEELRDDIYKEKGIMKTPEEVAESFSRKPAAIAFPDAVEAIKNEKCPTCGESIEEFKDEISKREYEISGMCQKCQDSVFEGGDVQ